MSFDYSKLRGRMAERGVTQAQLAEKIGINKATLSVKLNGRYGFVNDEIITICKELGIHTDEISRYFFCSASSES
jgi:transcriptional regulator with XRE-family HTH domain